MKKTIGVEMFLAGLYIWSAVLGFLIGLPFSHILNTEDVLPASLTIWVKGFISLAALFAVVFFACKRYVLPASILRLALWMAVISFVLSGIYLFSLPLILGSKGVPSFISLQAILTLVVSSLIVGVESYLALWLFSRNSSEFKASI